MFGRNIGARTAVSESQWGRFVDREITPRFPDGLTVYNAAGQWRDRASNKIMREPSKVVQIVLPGHDDDIARLNEIAEAYKARFKQQSVGTDRAAGLRVVLGPAKRRGRALVVLAGLRRRGLLPNYLHTRSEMRSGRQGARVMDQVKFVALDRDDLEVVSTHLQDALVKVADVIWRPQEKRVVVGAQPLRLARGRGNAGPSCGAAARRCVSSGSTAASAATSIPPARMRCSTCSPSSSPRPTRPPGS